MEVIIRCLIWFMSCSRRSFSFLIASRSALSLSMFRLHEIIAASIVSRFPCPVADKDFSSYLFKVTMDACSKPIKLLSSWIFLCLPANL
ncbi:hypothetical protein LIER_09145 [Lithospermum erythrorhizon]|uniref:Secreted protein n=1 Tax=Lithospermum erythrorhizon TaxID=34254 RepID=A0AAV3PIY5_LITER